MLVDRSRNSDTNRELFLNGASKMGKHGRNSSIEDFTTFVDIALQDSMGGRGKLPSIRKSRSGKSKAQPARHPTALRPTAQRLPVAPSTAEMVEALDEVEAEVDVEEPSRPLHRRHAKRRSEPVNLTHPLQHVTSKDLIEAEEEAKQNEGSSNGKYKALPPSFKAYREGYEAYRPPTMAVPPKRPSVAPVQPTPNDLKGNGTNMMNRPRGFIPPPEKPKPKRRDPFAVAESSPLRNSESPEREPRSFEEILGKKATENSAADGAASVEKKKGLTKKVKGWLTKSSKQSVQQG